MLFRQQLSAVSRSFHFIIASPHRLILAIAASLSMIGTAGAVEVYKNKGVEWTRVPEEPMDFAAATAYCAGKINGRTGWRLPTGREAGEGPWSAAGGSGSEYDFRNEVGPRDRGVANNARFWTSTQGKEDKEDTHWATGFNTGNIPGGMYAYNSWKMSVTCVRLDVAGAKPAAKSATPAAPKTAAGSGARAVDTKLPGATSTYEADSKKRDAQARADKKASDAKAVTDKAQADQQLSTEQAAARATAKARADKAAPCVKDGTAACNVSK